VFHRLMSKLRIQVAAEGFVRRKYIIASKQGAN
jgi:hypothetical protein